MKVQTFHAATKLEREELRSGWIWYTCLCRDLSRPINLVWWVVTAIATFLWWIDGTFIVFNVSASCAVSVTNRWRNESIRIFYYSNRIRFPIIQSKPSKDSVLVCRPPIPTASSNRKVEALINRRWRYEERANVRLRSKQFGPHSVNEWISINYGFDLDLRILWEHLRVINNHCKKRGKNVY